MPGLNFLLYLYIGFRVEYKGEIKGNQKDAQEPPKKLENWVQKENGPSTK